MWDDFGVNPYQLVEELIRINDNHDKQGTGITKEDETSEAIPESEGKGSGPRPIQQGEHGRCGPRRWRPGDQGLEGAQRDGESGR